MEDKILLALYNQKNASALGDRLLKLRNCPLPTIVSAEQPLVFHHSVAKPEGPLGFQYWCTNENTIDVWHLTPPANINTNTSIACDTSSIKVDITDTVVLCKMIRSSYVYNVIPTDLLIISCNNIVLTIPSTRVLFVMSYINIVLNITPTLMRVI